MVGQLHTKRVVDVVRLPERGASARSSRKAARHTTAAPAGRGKDASGSGGALSRTPPVSDRWGEVYGGRVSRDARANPSDRQEGCGSVEVVLDGTGGGAMRVNRSVGVVGLAGRCCKRLALGGVLAGVLSATLMVGTAWATFPGENGRISMSVFSATGENIATVEPNGSHLRLLTHSQTQGSFFAAWSPSGRMLAFDVFPQSPGGGQIWVMRGDGSHKRRIAGGSPFVLDSSPAWSPDGRWVVFVHSGSTDSQIWEVHPDGSSQHRLLAIPNHSLGSATFSPDGRRIAFTDTIPRIGTSQVDTARADGTHVQLIPNTRRVQGFAPNWSPDGRWIAFANHAVGLSSIVIIRPDGSGLHQLTRPGVPHYNDINPVWSPEGNQLAFQRSPCPDPSNGCPLSHIAIWIIGANGSRPHTITHNPKLNYLNADWGRKL